MVCKTLTSDIAVLCDDLVDTIHNKEEVFLAGAVTREDGTKRVVLVDVLHEDHKAVHMTWDTHRQRGRTHCRIKPLKLYIYLVTIEVFIWPKFDREPLLC